MRTAPAALAISILALPDVLSAQNTTFDGSAAAIHEVVSGKKCLGDDLLIFGVSDAAADGRYERVGRPPGTYQVGYGTIVIYRGQQLHGHLASVSVHDHTLYMSTGTYRCAP